jgi:DNA-binding beta-propeller fold protein YncE
MSHRIASRLSPALLVLLAAAAHAGCGGSQAAAPLATSQANTGGGAPGTGGGGGAGGQGGAAVDPNDLLTPPKSCAYECPDIAQCPESKTPYVCPAMADYKSLPHLDACGGWDGTYPAPAQGKCTATAPTGAALARTGKDAKDPSTYVLPDGRRTKPAGAEWIWGETELLGGMTGAIAAIPGTSLVLTIDTGEQHSVRLVDTTKIGSGDPVLGYVKFDAPAYLNRSIAFVPPNRAYVATAYGVVQALAIDVAKGTIARDDASSLTLPGSKDANGDPTAWYVAAVAVSPDGKRLVATPVDEQKALVFDVDPASPTYKTQLGAVDLGVSQTFGAAFDPNDAAGRYVYVSCWGDEKVLEVDLADAAKPKVARTFATDKDPEGLAFLDARWMAIANDLGETLSLVDRVAGTVTKLPVETEAGLRGLDVSALAWDPAGKRLWATLAGVNAVAAYDVDLGASPPKLSPAGRLPTAWWPSGVVVQPDGGVVVTTLRGYGLGRFDGSFPIGGGAGVKKMRGSVSRVFPAPTAADLAAGESAVKATIAVGAQDGFPKVECPAGADDFPVPPTNDAGPSKKIDHIVFIVRENKTFDALLGDLPTVEGDPTMAMKASSKDMDRVWPNFRALAKAFTIGDNFFNLAMQSTQGHTWTTYGRANDFDELTWDDAARLVPLSGVANIGRPVEGSLFDWLQNNKVRYDILGEIVGNPASLPADYSPIDFKYPGGPFQNISFIDLPKSCHAAARARVSCDLGKLTYMTLPNDHTVGVSEKNATPEVMCAVNDEATGMIVDAISHSPMWASTLVIITEDDPQQGGDHVDYHRAPLVLVSPWVKRGYVSKTHIDVASLHKLFAHVLGLPYPNLVVKNAGLPLDMFTSTPDYAPYSFTHRVWPLECGKAATRIEEELTGSWDFSKPDAQPGLDAQVTRWMRGKQLTEMPPRLRAEIDARNARRASGLPPVDADGD